MIWTKQHIERSAGYTGGWIQKYLSDHPPPLSGRKGQAFRIGIIGGGPKGLFALHSLLHSIDQVDTTAEIEIYWINAASNFGSGPNFDPQLPDYLLINNCIGYVDAWDRSGIYESNKVKERPNLVNWLEKESSAGVPVKPTDFASRALVGCYLQEAAIDVINAVPENVRLYLLVDKVLEIERGDGLELTLSSHEIKIELDSVLLTTGHCYSNGNLVTGADRLSAGWQKNYLNDIWSADQLDQISGKDRVGIAGMGLTFIDVALHLTEGRGGEFTESGLYIPSGKEPTIYPFSRSGQPILPRSAAFGAEKYRLQYLTDGWLSEKLQILKHRKIDFFGEILPLLEKEVIAAFHSRLISVGDQSMRNEYKKKWNLSEGFGLRRLLFEIFGSQRPSHETVVEFLSFAIAEVEKGEAKSPLLAAMAVWREALPLIGQVYAHGGLTGSSQQKLDKELLGALNRTSFGPPVQNMKKIHALAKAGIIRFDMGKQVEVSVIQGDKFSLSTKTSGQTVDYLIDARVARPQLNRDNSPLYRQLLKANLIKPYSNEGYLPGCVSLDQNGRTTVDAPDSPTLYFYGSNTEGVLLDNDSLSRTRNNLGAKWAEMTINQFIKKKHTVNELHL